MKVNAETEQRLSDEYQSQAEIEPERPRDKVSQWDMRESSFNFDKGKFAAREECE